jgi:Fuc2NAc and GlcNAc transferase
MRRWCFRHGLIDIPNERSSHSRPIPRGGGLVIVAVVLTGLAIGVWLSSISQSVFGGWLGAVLVAAVNWIDDLRSLPVRARLAAQGVAAALVLACGALPAWSAPLVGNVTLGWAWPVLSCFVLVGLTNAYNFMDGVDGIAAGQAVVAGIAWAIAGVHLGYPLAGWAGSRLRAYLWGTSEAGRWVFSSPGSRLRAGRATRGFQWRGLFSCGRSSSIRRSRFSVGSFGERTSSERTDRTSTSAS